MHINRVVPAEEQSLRQTARMTLLRTGAIAAVAVSVFLFSLSVPAGAEEEKRADRFMLRFGGYKIQNADTIGRLDANNLPVGTYVDFRDTLGGEDGSTVFRLDGIYRFNDRHAIGFSWYDVKFSGSTVLGQEIVWNGVTYPATTPVNSELKFDVYKVNYQYSLFHNEQAELGASFGLHVMKTFFSIDAPGINQSENVAVTAPMPVFGLFANYQFTPRLSAYYNIQTFFIDYEGKVRGGLQDFLLGLEYRLLRHVAVGTAYNRFALNVKVKGDNQTIYVDSSWNGLMLYGAVYF